VKPPSPKILNTISASEFLSLGVVVFVLTFYSFNQEHVNCPTSPPIPSQLSPCVTVFTVRWQASCLMRRGSARVSPMSGVRIDVYEL
jgi:hypothetical protein